MANPMPTGSSSWGGSAIEAEDSDPAETSRDPRIAAFVKLLEKIGASQRAEENEGGLAHHPQRG